MTQSFRFLSNFTGVGVASVSGLGADYFINKNYDSVEAVKMVEELFGGCEFSFTLPDEQLKELSANELYKALDSLKTERSFNKLHKVWYDVSSSSKISNICRSNKGRKIELIWFLDSWIDKNDYDDLSKKLEILVSKS